MSVGKSKWISVEILLLSAHFVEIVEEEVLTFETFLQKEKIAGEEDE
jgi:hypothetical protein